MTSRPSSKQQELKPGSQAPPAAPRSEPKPPSPEKQAAQKEAAVVQREMRPAPVRTMEEVFRKNIKVFEAMVPSHIDASKLIRTALIEMRRSPKLMQCRPASILGGVMTAAQLGLELGSHLGQAWLIPFKQEAVFIAGYRGMVQLAYRSGQVRNIHADPVYEADTFSFAYGTNPHLTHTPSDLPPGERGEITHFYAVASLANGGHAFRVMTRAEVMQVRERSPGARKPDSPWNHPVDWLDMGRKTVIRRLAKYLPQSVEWQKAVALDELAEAGKGQDLASAISWDDLELTPDEREALEPEGPADETQTAGEEEDGAANGSRTDQVASMLAGRVVEGEVVEGEDD